MDAAWMRAAGAFARAQQQWTVEQQCRLTAIAAPTGNESARALEVQRAMRQNGANRCDLDGTGNVRTVIGSGPGAPVVCLAHLDAVYDAPLSPGEIVPVHREGPLLRGAGIGDNGRGLAALLLLTRVLTRVLTDAQRIPAAAMPLRRPVHLVATVGEEGEGNLRGARGCFDDLAEQGIEPYAAIAIDGPGDESIVHHAVGSHRLRIALHGPGGHSWVHAADANPIHVLGEFIARAARLGDARQRDAVVHITRMHGGESLNTIPQHAWVDVELRGTSPSRLHQLHGELFRLVHQLTPGSLRAEVTVLGERPAGSLHAEHALVRAAEHATIMAGGMPRSASASTDANIPLSRGIPAIAVGAGGAGGSAHTSAEWYDDTQAARGLERLVRLVLQLAAS